MAAVVVTGSKITPVPELFGQKRFVAFTITTDTGDYADGGFALPATVRPAAFGMSQYDTVIIQPTGVNADGAYLASWNSAAQKVKLYEQSDSDNALPFAQAADGAVVAATFVVWAIGS